MDGMAERISEVIDKLADGHKSNFARRINVTPAYVTILTKGRNLPSGRTIADICREYNVNEQWLRTGEGDMLIPLSRNEELAAFFGDVLKNEDEDFRKQLLIATSQLSTEAWETLEFATRELIRGLDKAEKEDPAL